MNKAKTIIVAAVALASLGVASDVEAQQQPAQQAAPQLPQAPNMTYFVTSVGPGKGADLGGLEGADQYCQQLAQRHTLDTAVALERLGDREALRDHVRSFGCRLYHRR